MSARLIPAARTRTRTRSAVGSGASGTSTTCKPSTPPNEIIFTAFTFAHSNTSSKDQISAGISSYFAVFSLRLGVLRVKNIQCHKGSRKGAKSQSHAKHFSFALNLLPLTLRRMSLLHVGLMFGAAFAAGLVNSIAGGGTLLTFPLLIWLGLDPKVANATSTVALWPGLFGGVFGDRREMSDSSLILMRLGAVSVIGGGLGAWLLILTPSLTFARLVPFLILFATILFMLQGPVNRWLRVPSPTAGSQKSWWTIAIVVQFFSAMYGG